MSILSGTRLAAPLNLQEVYSVMGVSAVNGLKDVGYICGNGHGRINKWARNKPVRVNQPGEITDAQRKAVYQGLSVSPYGYKNLYEEYASGMKNAWKYLPPRPGTDWCRLTDFVGYNHDAEPFLRTGIPEGSTFEVSKINGGTITFEMKTPAADSGQLSVSDFTGTYNLSSGKVGAILFAGNPVSETSLQNPIGYQEGDSIAGSTNPSITVDFTDISVEGAVTVVFGIVYQTSGNTYMPFPMVDAANSWKCVVQVTNRAILNVGFSFNQAGFNGASSYTSLQNIFNFQSSGTALKVEEHGALSLLVSISVRTDSNIDYTISAIDQFLVGVKGGNLGSEHYLSNLRISSVNGSAFTGSAAISPGSTASVLLTCNKGDYLFPYSMSDGRYQLTLRDSRLSLSQDPLATEYIYLNNYPF